MSGWLAKLDLKTVAKRTGRGAGRLIGVAALALLGLLIEEYVNPFGVVEAIKEHSATVVQQVAAPLRDVDWRQEWPGAHPAPNQAPSEDRMLAGQKKVTVVLIDQSFIDLLNDRQAMRGDLANCRDAAPAMAAVAGTGKNEPTDIGWPLPVNVMVRCVLGRLAAAKPGAIFVDIAFPDVPRQIEAGGGFTRRESAETLGKAMSGRADGDPGFPADLKDVPLLVGSDIDEAVAQTLHHGPECVDPSRADGATLNSPFFLKGAFAPPRPASGKFPRLEVVSAGWSGGNDVYPLLPQLMARPTACKTAFEKQDGYLISPALRLYEIVAGKGLGVSADPFPGRIPPTTGLRTYVLENEHWREHYTASVMVPMWGAHLSKLSRDAYGEAENADICGAHQHSSLMMALRAYASNIFGNAAELNPCPYIDTVYMTSLFDDDFWKRHGSAFLKNRAVLLGVDLPVTADRMRSPINQELPGVYAHAAAVENLFRFDGHFHSEAPGKPAIAVMALLFVAVTLGMRWFAPWILHHMRHLPHLRAGALIWLVALGALLFAILCVLTLLLVVVQAGLGLPAKEIAIPLFFAHLPVWHAIIEEIEDYARDVGRECWNGVRRICRRDHPAQPNEIEQD